VDPGIVLFLPWDLIQLYWIFLLSGLAFVASLVWLVKVL
jgi:hypothetical protein